MVIFNEKAGEIENFTVKISDEALKKAAYRNFDVNNIFPDYNILRYVKENHKPEDVFDEDSLINWAEENGFSK